MLVRTSAMLLSLLVLACAGAPRQAAPPAEAARAWLEASRRDDPRTAYQLLAEPLRRQLPYERFVLQWRQERAEREAQARALESAAGNPAPKRARVELADGKVTELVFEDGWRLETPLVSPAHADSPEEALRLLSRAVETRSLEAALRIMTAERRKGLNDALEAFLAGLKAHQGDEIIVAGDRAFLQWSDNRGRWKVTLLREEGEWRIDDIDRQ